MARYQARIFDVDGQGLLSMGRYIQIDRIDSDGRTMLDRIKLDHRTKRSDIFNFMWRNGLVSLGWNGAHAMLRPIGS